MSTIPVPLADSTPDASTFFGMPGSADNRHDFHACSVRTWHDASGVTESGNDDGNVLLERNSEMLLYLICVGGSKIVLALDSAKRMSTPNGLSVSFFTSWISLSRSPGCIYADPIQSNPPDMGTAAANLPQAIVNMAACRTGYAAPSILQDRISGQKCIQANVPLHRRVD